jgi:hypothetical protein
MYLVYTTHLPMKHRDGCMCTLHILDTSKKSVLESDTVTQKDLSNSQPRLHRFPTPGNLGEAKELDEACCWGKEITNASKHCYVQLSPYPRAEHQKYQAVLALVRASASLTTRTRSLSGHTRSSTGSRGKTNVSLFIEDLLPNEPTIQCKPTRPSRYTLHIRTEGY